MHEQAERCRLVQPTRRRDSIELERHNAFAEALPIGAREHTGENRIMREAEIAGTRIMRIEPWGSW